MCRVIFQNSDNDDMMVDILHFLMSIDQFETLQVNLMHGFYDPDSLKSLRVFK